MIQPELPYYGNYPTEAFAFDPMRDLKEAQPPLPPVRLAHDLLHRQRRAARQAAGPGNLQTGQAARPRPSGDPPGRRVEHGGELRLPKRPDERVGARKLQVRCALRRARVPEPLRQAGPAPGAAISGAMLPPVTLADARRTRWRGGARSALGRRLPGCRARLADAIIRNAASRPPASIRPATAMTSGPSSTSSLQQGKTYSAQGLFNAFWDVKIQRNHTRRRSACSTGPPPCC